MNRRDMKRFHVVDSKIVQARSSGYVIPMLYIIAVLMLASASFADTLNLAGAKIDGVYPQVSGFIGGAFFARADDQSAGNGVINPFLIIQHSSTEQGYNTDGTLPWDAKQAHFTRNLQIGDLGVVEYLGVQYFEFYLDANQNANDRDGKATLSIDQIKIFTSPIGSIDVEDLSGLGTLQFDLGAGNHILIDAAIGKTAGIGSNDMLARIPYAPFSGLSPDEYLYFYNLNGTIRQSNAGAETWNALFGGEEAGSDPDPVPEPSSVLLIGTGVLGLGIVAWRRKQK